MFTEVAAEDLLREVRAYDFGSDPAHEHGANRIDAIVAFDRVQAAAKAGQLAQIAGLYAERSAQMRLGSGDPALSVIGEIGMARNVSPSAAGTLFALAVGVVRLPRVFGLLETGQISEAAARAVVRESDSLSIDDFVVLDAEIAPLLPGLTAIKAGQAAARAVIRIDAEAARIRAERNRADQRVSMFPDTDGVAILQVRGPAEQILAAHTALDDWARTLRGAGDERTVGQIMVQTLVERVTGITYAEDINVEVQLVMDAPTLLGADGEPVDLVGYGPISPDIADDLRIGSELKIEVPAGLHTFQAFMASVASKPLEVEYREGSHVENPGELIMWQVLIHMAFIFSAIGLALIDRLQAPTPAREKH